MMLEKRMGIVMGVQISKKRNAA